MDSEHYWRFVDVGLLGMLKLYSFTACTIPGDSRFFEKYKKMSPTGHGRRKSRRRTVFLWTYAYICRQSILSQKSSSQTSSEASYEGIKSKLDLRLRELGQARTSPQGGSLVQVCSSSNGGPVYMLIVPLERLDPCRITVVLSYYPNEYTNEPSPI